MREVVFLGGREYVLAQREKSIEMMSEFFIQHQLAGEIRTASDPFFVAPDAISKTYFQLSSDSKYEISLILPEGERLAVGSHNYHSDFFGRAFATPVEGGGPMHSVCVAFGLERWVYAFLQQHGANPSAWPEVMRGAREFKASSSFWHPTCFTNVLAATMLLQGLSALPARAPQSGVHNTLNVDHVAGRSAVKLVRTCSCAKSLANHQLHIEYIDDSIAIQIARGRGSRS